MSGECVKCHATLLPPGIGLVSGKCPACGYLDGSDEYREFMRAVQNQRQTHFIPIGRPAIKPIPVNPWQIVAGLSACVTEARALLQCAKGTDDIRVLDARKSLGKAYAIIEQLTNPGFVMTMPPKREVGGELHR